MIDTDIEKKLDTLAEEIRAEVQDAKVVAARADAHAQEAIRRIGDVKSDMVRLDERMSANIAEVHEWMAEQHGQLGSRLDLMEESARAHREALIEHVKKGWEVANNLKENDRDLAMRQDAMAQRLALLYAALTVLGLVAQRVW